MMPYPQITEIPEPFGSGIFALSGGVAVLADLALLVLVDAQTLEFLNEACVLQYLDGCLVFGHADAQHFGDRELFHDHGQECLHRLAGVALAGVGLADVVANFPGAVVHGTAWT